MRRIPYEGNIPLFLVTFLDPDTGKGLHACPRALLQKIIGQIDEELGAKPFSGAEFEFFQFKGKIHASFFGLKKAHMLFTSPQKHLRPYTRKASVTYRLLHQACTDIVC